MSARLGILFFALGLAGCPVDREIASCRKATCASAGAQCGSLSDGCGGELSCGTCAGPESCGGGGRPNVCGCTKVTCASASAECGVIADGCGVALECGTCATPASCGGDGRANRCGCIPSTCGKRCGEPSDGCGGQLACRQCEGDEVCGGAGTPNVCALPCSASGWCWEWPKPFGGTVTALYAPDDTRAWASIGGRLARWENGRWQVEAELDATSLVGTGGDDVWAATGSGGLARWDGRAWVSLPSLGGYPPLLSMAGRRRPVVLAGRQLFIFGDGVWRELPSPPFSDGLTALWAASEREIWIADAYGRAAAWRGSGWTSHPTGSAERLTALAGGGGSLWAGSARGTLFEWGTGGWRAPPTGLSGWIQHLSVTSAGEVWLLADDALYRRDASGLHRETEPAQSVRAFAHSSAALWVGDADGVVAARQSAGWVQRAGFTPLKRQGSFHPLSRLKMFAGKGELLVPQPGGLLRYDGTRWEDLAAPEEVTSAVRAADGVLWLRTAKQELWWRDAQAWKGVSLAGGDAGKVGFLVGLAAAPVEGVWVLDLSGRLAHCTAAGCDRFAKLPDGLSGGALAAGPAGELWIAAFGPGDVNALYRYEQGVFTLQWTGVQRLSDVAVRADGEVLAAGLGQGELGPASVVLLSVGAAGPSMQTVGSVREVTGMAPSLSLTREGEVWLSDGFAGVERLGAGRRSASWAPSGCSALVDIAAREDGSVYALGLNGELLRRQE